MSFSNPNLTAHLQYCKHSRKSYINDETLEKKYHNCQKVMMSKVKRYLKISMCFYSNISGKIYQV